ncbi:TonB-dependent siderophore receptor [Pseudomonas chlororaphis subsp. chlororaphis]|nr:TonB-dependent siderophore receptor [Pseudomonas chlororaphis]AZD03472.1 Outer membrane receptor for ferric coprogen and ferric-rhodotorulic acid [Pseudomonas chlororaphis subsp. chlororaphis]MBM0284928.1 TonB-dependent siderophore receptor [Pseudomonas chlororaphis]ORM45884.1 TonB-dependent siderophore receptor [Pseudomonas chlororaphis subsp. chlororaphis]WDG95979.1 TonB-dependent siderophore receptor [Pseudomonas chlororaphis]WDH14849.1 TonB-dependent siderophore receptor [Pseudomonas ch
MPAVLGLSPLSKALSMRKALNIKLLPSALALAVSLPVAGYVQAQEIELDIPVQSLGTALQEFGRQTNLQVLYSPQDVQGKQSTAVKGKMDTQRAIDILLTGSGIRYSLQGNSLTLSATSAGAEGLELSPTQVTANQLGNVTEGTGSYTPGTIATATRLPLTLRETPQSISVVTRQHMDDFALNSVDAVMRHTPGITVSAFDTDRTNYYSRGFSINNFQYDGIPSAVRNVAYSAGNTLSDMAIYDRIEVLKGASGLLSGAGSLGGTINLVRKKPTADFQGHATLGAGSWDNYRSELDVSGPLTETGNVRGRAVAAYQDKNSFIDRYSTKNSVFYGIVEFDLSPDTLLTVGADYQDNDPRGSTWSGSFPLLNSKGERNDAKRSFSNATDWSSWQQYTRTVFATLEHDLGDGWVTKLQLDHKYNGYDAQMGSIQFDQPQPDGSAEINAQRYKGDTTSDSADLYVSGPFSMLGRDHDLVLGGSISKAHWKGKGYWDETFSVPNRVDYNNWHGNLPKPDWGPVSQRTDDVIRQTGVYMTTRLNVTDDLKVLLGGRVVNYSLTGLTPTYTESGRFIPYAGAIYDLNENFSVYASYTDVFMPQENFNRDRDNKLIEPDEGENYEIGIKSEFFDGRLNASLAYFEVKETNRSVPDDAYNNQTPTPPNYAFKGSKATTKGYELEVSGELAPGWQVQGGYTHKVVRDDNDVKLSTFEPEDQLSLYTTYKLTGDLDKMTIGGGARWQNKAWQQIWNSPKGVNEDITQESYWVVDLMTRYQITKNLSATLNVNNIFDKYYYTNVGFYNSAIYGEPRNVMVTTRWDF